jgi:hypothetical protein
MSNDHKTVNDYLNEFRNSLCFCGSRHLDKVTVSERTIIKKIFEGIDSNDWFLVRGSTAYAYNATNRDMVKPLVEYLRKKGIEVK